MLKNISTDYNIKWCIWPRNIGPRTLLKTSRCDALLIILTLFTIKTSIFYSFIDISSRVFRCRQIEPLFHGKFNLCLTDIHPTSDHVIAPSELHSSAVGTPEIKQLYLFTFFVINIVVISLVSELVASPIRSSL